MYTPHIVTLYNMTKGVPNITVLDGVFLDISKGANVIASGLESADAATLFIPFSIEAVNGATGQAQFFVGAKEYERLEDKSAYWTLNPAGASNECFFVKGMHVAEDGNYQSINSYYDDVYRVTSVDTYDYGSESMQHWEVGGK